MKFEIGQPAAQKADRPAILHEAGDGAQSVRIRVAQRNQIRADGLKLSLGRMA
ncbi:hypothetical protein D9M68_582520 [compost metagenome]